MKIIRALWGNSEYVRNEIPKIPMFGDNEIVFVWGLENKVILDNFNYESILVSDEITDYEYNSHLLHFAHKLKAISIAESFMSEFLFLDWDITLAKEIDDNFYQQIRSGNNIQCPLYAYHGKYRQDVESYHRRNKTFSLDLDSFLYHHIQNLEKYHWKLKDIKVLPCFCFFYVNDIKIGKTLLNIMENNGIVACIEEFAFQLYCDCSLDQYIDKYEPTVIRGKEKDKNLVGMTKAITEINSYINTKVNKDIYLFHDII
jgi:hypothetical protein